MSTDGERVIVAIDTLERWKVFRVKCLLKALESGLVMELTIKWIVYDTFWLLVEKCRRTF